jgi:hypothetical protein
MRNRSLVPLVLLAFLASGTAWSSVAVLGPLAYEHVAAPGQPYGGTLELQNTGDGPADVRVYQSDYFFYADGRSLYGEAGVLPRSNARWVSVSPAQLRIPAGEKAVVRYAVQVPDDASLAGSYWSVIMVEPVEQSTTESGADKSGVEISQVLRFAIQIVTQIGSSGNVLLGFTRLQLQAVDGLRSLLVDAENTGERWYRANVWAEIYDAEGRFIGRYDGGTFRMYPGTSARFTADLTGVQRGTYKALVVADCGGDDVFGANVDLVLNQ